MQNKLLTIATILTSVAVLLLAAFFIWQPYYVGENCALYLDCARLLLSGHKPYIDFIDLNPPLATYLACLPVLISTALKIPLVPCFLTMVLAVVSLSCALTARVCYRLYRANQNEAFLLMPFALALSNLPLLFCFGERDHLIALALVPFFIFRFYLYQQKSLAVDRGLRTEQLLLGISVGLALALKPQCVLIILCSDLFFMTSAKKISLSLDLLIIVLVLVAYAAHFLLLPPPVKDAYFGWLLPLMTNYYNAFNVPFSQAAALYTYLGPIVRSPLPLAIMIILSIAGGKRSPLLLPLAAFACGAYLVYLIQGKGWGYQTIHVVVASFLMAAALIPIFFRSLLQRLKSPLSGEKMLLIEAALLVAVVTPLAYDSSQTGKELCDCDQWINRYTRPGDNVLIVSSAVAPAYPSLLLLDRKNGSRYLWSAPLVMLEYARTEQEKIQKAAKARQKSVAAAPAQTQTQAEDQIELIENQERQILERLEQDIHERKPKLVMVEYCQFVGRQNLFEVLARRGIIQNDLGAYQNLGICNRFVGFVYTGDTRSSFESTFADLGAPQSPPSSAPGCPGLAHMERFRLALATIARADRKILLKSAGAEPIDYCRRGQAYLDISMYQSAAADFQRALNTAAVGADKAAGPIQEDAYIELGYCMLHIQHYQEARDKFLQALALAPSTRAQAGLGVASLALGQDKAAQACAAAALSDQAGGSPPTKPVPNKQSTALAHALLAAIKRREGDLGAAAAEADLAMGMDPDCARGYLEKAWILGAQKKFDQMLRMADESIDRNYANTEAHLCRAQALKNLSQPGFECEKTVAASLAGKE